MRLVLCMCAALLLSACSDKTQEGDAAATAVLQFNVSGMSCGNCENAISTTVAKIDGVVSCEASHEDGRVSVEVTRDDLASSITSSITELGFTVDG